MDEWIEEEGERRRMEEKTRGGNGSAAREPAELGSGESGGIGCEERPTRWLSRFALRSRPGWYRLSRRGKPERREAAAKQQQERSRGIAVGEN